MMAKTEEIEGLQAEFENETAEKEDYEVSYYPFLVLFRSHITLSSISAEKQHHSDREFAMRVAFDVTGFI